MTTPGNNAGDRATLRPAFDQFLPGWLARQRWYTGKEHTPQLTRVGGLRWQDPRGAVGIETHLVLDSGGAEPVLYHVPLTYRDEPLPEHVTGPDALVVVAEHSESGTRWIYDACHDPRYAQVLLDSLTGAGPLPQVTLSSPAQDGAAGQALGEGRMAFAKPAPGVSRIPVHSARVLRGEQSNTSIIINDGAPGVANADPGQESTTGGDSAQKVIVKVFRVLRPGPNPEVEVMAALADVGSTEVPAPVGALGAAWRAGSPSGQEDDGADEGASGGPRSAARVRGLGAGHLAFASEFLPGARDAWEMALAAAEARMDVSGPAFSLGETTARLHQALREAFPQHLQTDRIRTELPADVRARFAHARADVPDLARYGDDLDRLIENALAETPWPPVQRVHGDFHLGQVLHAPGRGWVVVDFEGEPLRPIAERAAPTLALRDVAGMLRSFDYAAAGTGADQRWVDAARGAFLDGYSSAGESDAGSHAALLRLLELDKACYEARYEARNRPAWLPIPLAAIARLIEEPL